MESGLGREEGPGLIDIVKLLCLGTAPVSGPCLRDLEMWATRQTKYLQEGSAGYSES